MAKDSISISSTGFEKIVSEIRTLSIICTDDVVKKRLMELINHLNRISDGAEDIMSIEDIIGKKLEETKRTNKELNADLYILYQNLIRGKISEEKAKQIFEDYLRMEEYNKGNYV